MHDDLLVQQLRNTPEETALVLLTTRRDDGSTPPLPFSPQERVEVERRLISFDLIDSELNLAHQWFVTPRGARVAEKLRATRTSGAGRRAMVEKALMRHIEDDEPQTLDDFAGRVIDGTPVSDRELSKAFQALEDYGLAKAGFQSLSGITHMPELTSSGRAAVDDPRDPIDFVRQGGVVTYDNRNHVENHGTMNAAVAGHHAVQSGNTFHNAAIAEVSAVLDELRRELDVLGDVPVAATQVVEQMTREAGSTNPDSATLSSLSSAFTGAIAAKFGEDAYQAVPGLIARLGSLIATLA